MRHMTETDAVEYRRMRARERKRAQRDRERRAQVMAEDDPSATDADALNDHLSPPGLFAEAEGAQQFSGDLVREQALWVFERRKLTALELARRRGELIQLDEARTQSQNLARRIRAALDRAPQLLPADLPPDVRAACSTALATAIKNALKNL